MNPDLVDAGIAAGTVAVWFLGYGLALLATRPASVRPAPATQDLGAEPPAVVSLLANRWELTEDAAESTLLDLAARRHIELRQPGNDPMQTTLHLRAATDTTSLAPYEKRVLDRVAGLAVGGVLPVTALTFRNERQARTWNRRLRAQVVTDARRRGLTRRRFGKTAVGLLVTGAALVAVVLAVVAGRYAARSPDEDDGGMIVAALVFGFAILAGLAGRYPGERDTAAGREAAARWLGVRDWLRGHEEFGNLTPASVTVWDRYLAYGAALGATRLASAVLDLGMGNRRLVWSSYGGSWHRVRVRYPRLWPRYGRPAGRLVLRSLVPLATGSALIYVGARARQWLSGLDPQLAPDRPLDLFEPIALGLGLGLLALGGYQLSRTLLDVATPRTITGEVLWLQVWRKTSGGKDRPAVPWLYHLAVDDGGADRTVAWGLPAGYAGVCQAGDTVRMTVRRWSRRVTDLTVVEPGRSRALVESTVDTELEEPVRMPVSVSAPLGAAAATVAAVLRAPTVSVGDLLTADEVGQALGLAVRPPTVASVPGGLAIATFASAGRRRKALMVQVAQGAMAQWAWRANARGTAHPGIGDDAYVSGDRGVLRAKDTVVILTLLRAGKGRQAQLPWLLTQAANRLAATAASG